MLLKLKRCAPLVIFVLIGINSLASATENLDKSKSLTTTQNHGTSQLIGSDLKQEAMATKDIVEKLSTQIHTLKTDVINLNADLRLMEEKLLFPSNTKYSVFVSLDIGKYFTIESVKLKMDSKMVASHIYSNKQREAMARGGIHRLFTINLNEGKHSASAFFTGLGPQGRPFKRAVNLEFKKEQQSQHMEIAIVDDNARQEPKFIIRQW